jgi:hypothetical protein
MQSKRAAKKDFSQRRGGRKAEMGGGKRIIIFWFFVASGWAGDMVGGEKLHGEIGDTLESAGV